MPRVKKVITENKIIETIEDEKPIEVESPKELEPIEVVKKPLGNPVECGTCHATYGKNWCLSCFVWKQKNTKKEK